MLTPEERRKIVLQIISKSKDIKHPSYKLARMCEVIFNNRLSAMEDVINSEFTDLIDSKKEVINILIKPVGDMCNLRCKYCIASNKPKTEPMSYETLERLIQQSLDSFRNVTFTFHGGEPLLAGVEFFEKALEFQRKYNKNNQFIRNGVQTNGTLIDEIWSDLFYKNNFYVGVSLDGPAEAHNAQRIDASGRGSFTRVLKGINSLKHHNIKVGAITVVSCPPTVKPGELFDFIEETGISAWRVNPCRTNDSIKCYPDYICELFDIWLESGSEMVLHPIFEIINTSLGYSPFLCQMSGTCFKFIGIDPDGGLSPCCEMPVAPEFYLGNINDTSIKELLNTQKNQIFWNDKEKGDKLCKGCKWWDMCHGGCTYHRLMAHGTSFGKDFLCALYMELFEKLISRIDSTLTDGVKRL